MGQPLRSDGFVEAPARRRAARPRQLRLADAVAGGRSAAAAPVRPRLMALPAAAPALDAATLVQAAVGVVPGLRSLSLAADMPDALLARGDVVMLQPAGAPRDGELCAVRLPGAAELALRRVFHLPGGLRLQPENRAYPGEEHALGEVHVEGRVLAVLRQQD